MITGNDTRFVHPLKRNQNYFTFEIMYFILQKSQMVRYFNVLSTEKKMCSVNKRAENRSVRVSFCVWSPTKRSGASTGIHRGNSIRSLSRTCFYFSNYESPNNLRYPQKSRSGWTETVRP